MNITQKQMSIIIGVLLSDGYLTKTGSMQIE